MKLRTVLSLFDGISCGQVALQRAGIEFENYFASEVDKYAIQITQKNFPNTIQLGDVNNWQEWNIDWNSVDLIIGGSPCQGFSIAGKGLNFSDERSKLFFAYVAILKHVKELNPNVCFLFENVKMRKDYANAISYILNCKPVEINSALVSAQNRVRFYWTNIGEIQQPEDKQIFLKDIIHENTFSDREKSYCIDANYFKGETVEGYFKRKRKQLVFDKIAEFIIPADKAQKILEKEVERGKIKYVDGSYWLFHKKIELDFELLGILNTARGNNKGGLRYKGEKAPTLTCNKYEYNNYLFSCIDPHSLKRAANGRRFSDNNKFYTLTCRDCHGILTSGYLRKLTPIECERLQTLSDNYTEGVSNTQRYKTLGNGWTVDVITHILKYLKQGEKNK